MAESFFSAPLVFLKFWYIESPVGIFRYFISLNKAALTILSLPLFLKTYFSPIKNEYRKGLVAFSIGMGIFIKSLLIMVDLFLIVVLIVFEVLFFAGFVLWPVLSIWVLAGVFI